MTAIIIISALILLFTAIAFVRLKFFIVYNDGLTAYAKVLWFKIYLTGEPEKPINLKHFKIKRFRRRRDRIIKKYQNKLAKKSLKKSDTADKKEKSRKKKAFSSPSELLERVKSLLDGILIRFPRYLHVDIRCFVVEVGGEDAHQTALLYGGAVQGMQYLITSLDACSKLKCTKGARVGVSPNFLEKTFSSEVDITAHIRIYGAVHIGLKFLSNYFKTKLRRKPSVSKERMAK